MTGRKTGNVLPGGKVELLFSVTLTATDKPLGITIGGGTDDMVHPEANDASFYVTDVAPDAEAVSSVAVGDKIAGVSGTAMLGKTHDEGIACISAAKATGSVVFELVRRVAASEPTPEEYFAGRSASLTANTVTALLTPDSATGSFGLAMTGVMANKTTEGVFVAAVMAGSAAAGSSLERGYQVVEVNGWNTTCANQHEVVALLKAGADNKGAEVEVVAGTNNAAGFEEFAAETFSQFYSPSLGPVATPDSVGTLRKIVLARAEGEKLGLVLSGPPTGVDIGADGIFVSEVIADGAAAKDGRLRQGDEVLEINGAATTSATLATAAEALKGDNAVTLLVVANPMGFKWFSEQSRKSAAEGAVAVEEPAAAANAAAADADETNNKPTVITRKGTSPSADKVRLVKLDAAAAAALDLDGYAAGHGASPAGVYVCTAAGELAVGDQIVEVCGAAAPGVWRATRSASVTATRAAIVEAGETVYLSVVGNKAGYDFHCEVAAAGGFAAMFTDVEDLDAVAAAAAAEDAGVNLTEYPPLPFYVRACFAQEVGNGAVAFAAGDVLEVTAVVSPSVWTVTNLASGESGSAPSKAAHDNAFHNSAAWPAHMRRAAAIAAAVEDVPHRSADEAHMESLSIHSYVLVAKRHADTPRPIAVYGANADEVLAGVANKLASDYSLVEPVRTTTRVAREGETPGVTYNFISAPHMQALIKDNKMAEVGSFNESLYGLELSAVTAPAAQGKLVVLSAQPEALRRLARRADVHPVTLFVDGAELSAADKVCEDLYRDLFSHRLATGETLEATIEAAYALIKDEISGDYFAPTLHDLPTTVLDGDDHETFDFKTTWVARNAEGKFGFTVEGGAEFGGLPSIALGAASTPTVTAGSLVAKDKILQIDGRSVVGMTHLEVVNALSNAGKTLKLTIAPTLKRLHVVTLKSTRRHGFGFSLVSDDALLGRRVRDVTKGSPAQRAGLKHDDCIVAINGTPVLHAAHNQVLAMLSKVKEVTLVLAAPPAPPSKGALRTVNVTMTRSDNEGLGLDLATNPAWEYPEVAGINPDSHAAASGAFALGQMIVAVNGHSMKYAGQGTVVAAIRAKKQVTLTISCNIEAILVAGDNGYGMKLEFDEREHLYPKVLSLTPYGAANASGRVHPGDEIVEINGRSARCLDEATVFQRLAERPYLHLSLIPAHPDAVAAHTRALVDAALDDVHDTLLGRRTVVLERGNNGLGLIVASDDGSTWHKVADIIPGGAAALGGIKVNDVILSVNGVSMAGHPHHAIVEAISQRSPVALEVAQGRRKLQIDNSTLPFGLRLVSAASEEMFPVISSVAVGSASAVAHVQTGAHVFEINGKNMRGASESEIVGALRESEDHIVDLVVTIEPPAFDEDLLDNVRSVRIERGSTGLGLVFVTDENESFSIVKSIVEDSPAAAASPAIAVGDIIVKVNGEYMTNATHDTVANALIASPIANLIVADHPVPGKSYEGASVATPLGGPKTVELVKGDEGFGFKFTTFPPAERKFPVVSEIVADSPAASCSDLHVGDIILEVDGKSTTDVDHDVMVGIIKEAPEGKLTMLILHHLDESHVKGPNAGSPHAVDADTALAIAAGAPSRPKRATSLKRTSSGYGVKLTTVDGASHPVVTGIVDGTSAQEDGTVAAGDIILEVNGVNMAGLSHEEVVEAFSKNDDQVDLVVASGEHASEHGALVSSTSSDPHDVSVGDRVFVLGYGPQGTVKFVGMHAVQNTPRVLVQLDSPEGKNNGTIKGHSYCETLPDKTGVLVVPMKVFSVPPTAAATAVLRTVSLQRDGSIGLKLSTDEVPGSPTIVAELTAGGSAEASGQIVPGDALVTINGEIVYGAGHEVVIAAIGGATATIEFCLFGTAPAAPAANAKEPEVAEPAPEPFDVGAYSGRKTISFKRAKKEKLGLSLQSVSGHPAEIIDIDSEGAAAKNGGDFAIGDVIVSINGKNMIPTADEVSEVIHARVIKALKAKKLKIVLGFKPKARVWNVTRGEGGLGMQITSVGDVFRVSGVVPGSAAEKDGVVFVGDRIVSINEQSTAGKDHDEVIAMLTASPTLAVEITADASPMPAVEAAAAAVAPAVDDSFAAVASALTEAAATTDTRTATVVKGDGGLGMKISSLDGVFRISEVIENGAAAAAGGIKQGDQIKSINGTSTEGLSHDSVVDLLREKNEVTLTLVGDDSPLPEVDVTGATAAAATAAVAAPAAEEPAPAAAAAAAAVVEPETRTVTIVKGASGLGIKIASVESSFRVSEVIEGGAAAAAGNIFKGDDIVSVNGTSTADKTHEDVVALLTAQSEVKLGLVANDSPLPEVAAPSSAAAAATTEEPEPEPEPAKEEEARSVTITRGDGGLGLKLISDERASRISEVIAGGAAAAAGDIRVGDVIKSINGTSTEGKNHDGVLSLLKGQKKVTMELEADQSPLPAVQ